MPQRESGCKKVSILFSILSPSNITSFSRLGKEPGDLDDVPAGLPSLSALSPPENLVNQVHSLQEELQRVVAAFGFKEGDLFSPSRSQALRIQSQKLLERGDLDSYRHFKALQNTNKPAVFMINSLLERYSQAEKQARPDYPGVLVPILEGQGTLRAILQALFAQNEILQTAHDTWSRTAAQAVSDIVDEV